MTDKADRKVREWARDRNGDPLTPRDVVDLVFAQADDQEADHKESMARLALVEEQLEAFAARQTLIEEWRTKVESHHEHLVKQYIADEHDQRHSAYLASLQEDNFRSKMLWFFATGLGKFVLVAAGLVAGLLLNLVVYGRP